MVSSRRATGAVNYPHSLRVIRHYCISRSSGLLCEEETAGTEKHSLPHLVSRLPRDFRQKPMCNMCRERTFIFVPTLLREPPYPKNADRIGVFGPQRSQKKITSCANRRERMHRRVMRRRVKSPGGLPTVGGSSASKLGYATAMLRAELAGRRPRRQSGGGSPTPRRAPSPRPADAEVGSKNSTRTTSFGSCGGRGASPRPPRGCALG